MPRRRNRSGTDDSRRKFLKASGAGAVALSLAGCSGDDGNNQDTTTSGSGDGGSTTTNEGPGEKTETAENIGRGGTLVYGMDANPDVANIITSSSVYSAVGLSPVYNYGIDTDPVTFETKPNVFTDWTIKNADKEKPDVYFNVRKKGLKWNDGEKFKPIEDVLFTYNYFLDKQPGEYSFYTKMESIEEASNDWDFHIKMATRVGTWDVDILGNPPILPKHIWSNIDNYQKYKPMENDNGGPVGTGPGKLVQFNPDTSMQVKFRQDYIQNEYALNDLQWKKDHKQIITGGPFLDKVNFKVFGGSAAMTQAFMNGNVDTHYGSLEVNKIPKAKNTDGMGVMTGFDSGFSYIGYNVRRTPLDDVAFRQALGFMFDETYWVKQLKKNFVIKGDYAQAPGYNAVRPETVFDGKKLKDPATNAFDFRRKNGKIPDVQAVRKFLTDGNVIDGSSGTYAGKEYPGSLSGVKASQSEAKHDYSFGPVKTKQVKDAGADKEIRVNGKTIPEVMDGDAITMLMDPPGDKPKEAEAINQWKNNVNKLGIPMKTSPIEFNTMESKVYINEKYDAYPMGWAGTSPFGTSVRLLFHSDNAGNDSDKFAYNSTGYGTAGGSVDKLADEAQAEMDVKKRNKKWAKGLDRVYLDQPYFVMHYDKYRWPMNTAKFGGVVENVVDPAYATWSFQYGNMYLKENLKK